MATYESRRYNTPVTDASKIADGSVNNTEFQRLDGVTSDIQTQFTSLDNGKLNLSGGSLTGDITTNSNINLGDSDNVIFGAGQDMKLFSDGTVGYVYANDLRLQSMTGENYVTAAVNGATNLWYDNANKLQTTSSGANVTGTLVATTFSGSGASLTSLPAGNLTGTVADARISTLTSSKLTGALPAIDGSALTGISSVPSSLTAVGAIREFTIVTTQQAWLGDGNSASLAPNATVTPSTATFNGQSYLVLADAYQGNSSRRYKQGATPEQMIGTRTTITGTWRCISQLTAAQSGSNASFVGTSMPGLLQRIS